MYLLDSSTITLRLSLFDWAKYTHEKGVLKLHKLLDYEYRLPAFIDISNGTMPTNIAAYGVPVPASSIVVGDRGYMDFELFTNNTQLPAHDIGELYRNRWLVEIFFKGIKQLLHEKSFIGTSQKAVLIQLWTAMIAFLLLKYLKTQSQYVQPRRFYPSESAGKA